MQTEDKWNSMFHGWEPWRKSYENIFDFMIKRVDEIHEHKEIPKETLKKIRAEILMDLIINSVKLQYTENAIYENNTNFEVLIRFHDEPYKDKPVEIRAASMLDDLLLFLNSKELEFLNIAKRLKEVD
jgi:hypothetical protein